MTENCLNLVGGRDMSQLEDNIAKEDFFFFVLQCSNNVENYNGGEKSLSYRPWKSKQDPL